MIDYDLTTRTRTVARVVGPYLTVMAAALIARADTMALMLPAFMQDGPLVFAAGAFTLMAGLTLLALHHHFNGPAAIVITLIGIVAALKGALLMVAPNLGANLSTLVARATPLLLIVAVLLLIVGIWLWYLGWFAGRERKSA